MIYQKFYTEDVQRAIANLEGNVNFKKFIEFMNECLKGEESGCRRLREHIDKDTCLGRQQGIEAMIDATNIIKKS